jgi:antitoxin VapB
MLEHMPERKRKHGRHVRLFKNGRNQAVRIPRNLELPGHEALLYREGDRLVLEPLGKPSLVELLSSWEPIDTSWPEIDDPSPEPVELPD